MIILQTLTDTVPIWRQALQDFNQLAQIIGTILIIIYVVYTYKTFRQIKKQTDYQQDAYLRIDTMIIPELPTKKEGLVKLSEGKLVFGGTALAEKYIHHDFPNKMKSILQPIFRFEDNLFEGNYFVVVLTNYGNAEVNDVKLQLSVTIKNSKELVDGKMLREKELQTVKVEIKEMIGRNGVQTKIPLLSTAAFPYFEINLTGEYFDVRNKKYNINSITIVGENTHFHKLPV